jgi:hypothetical protein
VLQKAWITLEVKVLVKVRVVSMLMCAKTAGSQDTGGGLRCAHTIGSKTLLGNSPLGKKSIKKLLESSKNHGYTKISITSGLNKSNLRVRLRVVRVPRGRILSIGPCRGREHRKPVGPNNFGLMPIQKMIITSVTTCPMTLK